MSFLNLLLAPKVCDASANLMTSFPPFFTFRNDLGLDTEHAPQLEKAREAIQDALNFVSQPTPTFEANKGLLGGQGLFLRAIESCEATIILVDKGMAGAAWATLRTAFECLFYACALWRNPSRFEDFTEAHHKERLTQVDALRRGGSKGLSAESAATLDALASSQNAHQKWPAFNAAEEAGLKEFYELCYRGCGLAGAHATQRSLDRHFRKVDDGTEYAYAWDYSPNFDAAHIQIGWTIQCLATGIARLQEQLGAGTNATGTTD